MDSLRIVLVIVGVLVILGLLAHGLWTVRRNNQDNKGREQSIERKRRRQPDDLFSANEEIHVAEDEPQVSSLEAEGLAAGKAPHPQSSKGRRQPKSAESAEPHAEQRAEQRAEPSAELTAQQIEFDLDAEPSFDLEPTLGEELEPHELEPSEPPNELSAAQRAKRHNNAAMEPQDSVESASDNEQTAAVDEPVNEASKENEPEVITLFITGDIQGAILLQMTAELGLKFGEMDIFHRHMESSGHGPVLFSVANMFNPGTFDIHNMERFQTEGLVLFMTLPMKSDGHQAFTMMYNAANKIADAMPRAAVLDSNRNPVTKQSVQHTYQRIREFERQQRLHKPSAQKPTSQW